MKTKLLLSLSAILFLIPSIQLTAQWAHGYLLERGYAFPVECTLTEIGSIEKIRLFYKNKNDSLFLEHTIYKFERLVFLPGEERAKFDYISFYEEIVDTETIHLKTNKEKIGYQNQYQYDLNVLWHFVKIRAYHRLARYYAIKGNFKKAYQAFLMEKKITSVIYSPRCVWDNEDIISDNDIFYIFIGLNDIDLFVKTYYLYFWDYFINAKPEFFKFRVIPFLKMAENNLSKEERIKILENATASIECRHPNAIFHFYFMDAYVLINLKNLLGNGTLKSKETKEVFLKIYFKNTDFYKIFMQ